VGSLLCVHAALRGEFLHFSKTTSTFFLPHPFSTTKPPPQSHQHQAIKTKPSKALIQWPQYQANEGADGLFLWVRSHKFKMPSVRLLMEKYISLSSLTPKPSTVWAQQWHSSHCGDRWLRSYGFVPISSICHRTRRLLNGSN
jgi:hypothetical protein